MSSYKRIINALNKQLTIEHMFLENESSMHNVPPNSESHFKLIIASDDFIKLSKVKRHQLIYQILSKVMSEIHALSIQAFTIEEYKANPVIHSSPDCANKKL
mgnify:FL=1|tara:strand:- start:2897 stop:3202 length:306 start_codon:yes stop_codon:yes gene_type:complete